MREGFGPEFNPMEGQNKEAEARKGLLDRVREKIVGTVNESLLPAEEYDSTVGVYGGKLKLDSGGKLVFNNRGVISTFDRLGDAILRTFDEHTAKDLWKMIKRRPSAFFRYLVPGTKRYRGKTEEIIENVNRLGLGDFYGAHQDGVEIKKPEIYTQGRALQDIYRADLIGSEKLSEIDRFQALSASGKYIKGVHERGAIGELLVSDIIFQEQEGGQVANPVLNLPDIVYNADKYRSGDKPPEQVGLREKKATDILDFLANVAVEEFRRSNGNEEEVRKALRTFIESYDNREVIALTESLVRRGRLTLQGDVDFLDLPENIMTKLRPLTAQHNKARIGSKSDMDSWLKEIIVSVCEEYKTSTAPKTQETPAE